MTYIDEHEDIDLIQTWSSMMQKRLWELAHDIRMKKNPQTKEVTFWIFKDFD